MTVLRAERRAHHSGVVEMLILRTLPDDGYLLEYATVERTFDLAEALDDLAGFRGAAADEEPCCAATWRDVTDEVGGTIDRMERAARGSTG